MSIGEDILTRMDANNELMNALKTLLEVGKYSDLTIICGEKKYAVHRAIICSRSGFFDGACSSRFREAHTGIIDLSEDDPEAVEHMVHYFYNLDYLSTLRSDRTSRPTSPTITSPSNPFFGRPAPRQKLNLALVEDPLLATAAASYSMSPPQLSEPSVASPVSSPITPPITSPFLEFFPSNVKFPEPSAIDETLESNWDTRSTSSQDPDLEHAYLIIHARVYAIAEKYGIKGLKTLARNKFAAQMTEHFTSDEFAPALAEVYESTVDQDRGLRDIVIQTFRSHPDIATRADVEEVVRGTPGLAWELFRVGWGLPIKA